MRGWVRYWGQKTGETIGLIHKKERGNMLNWEQLNLIGLDGAPFDTATLTNKVVLVVNVASKCGLTPQYTALQALYEAEKDNDVVVLGVPCNQFLGQEPGSADQIAHFCTQNYGVTFPLLEKQEVNGGGRSSLYEVLVESSVGGGKPITWNFEKFLISKKGDIAHRFDPKTAPNAPEIVRAIHTLASE